MAGDSSSIDAPLPLSTVLHMLTIKLSPTNYLLWHKQMVPLLAYQQLTGYVDGSIPPPPATITNGETTSPNPAYASWSTADQRALILIQSSLSEEAMAETLGYSTSRAVWTALADIYQHDSLERTHTLRDSLRHLKKGNSTVSEYSRKFKGICDQLQAIGHPLTEDDKSHWFLCGLGSSFETFSTTQRLLLPRPKFRDLLSQAESHEMFLQSISDSSVAPVAFHTTSSRGSSDSSRGHGRSSRGSSNRGRGRGNRRRPTCQLCRKEGHYASQCPDLQTFARGPSSIDANLADAFHAQCSTSAPDWYVDTGASAHMTPTSANLDAASSYSGNDFVLFGNGNDASISHIGRSHISPNISLLDVLVVPKLTKSLLSVSKLTRDNPVDVVFSDPMFLIQNRHSKQTLAQGRRRNGLYILEKGQQAFLANLSSKRIQASFELWHSRLGHVSHDTISVLNKLGCLSISSILPTPRICSSCQLSKSKRLSFNPNLKRSMHVLDLVHCDLWGPSPVVSIDGFRFYAIFIDDYSRFTWFYPMKAKSDFSKVLATFVALVQTQFSCKIKIFQSDGGTEFTNNHVQALLSQNGTHHRLSCPYTPQQNGRAERKHRHLTETGLAIMFNAHVPAIFWSHAFGSAVYIINRLPTKLLDNKSPYELLFSTTPNYGNFRVFGCCVYPYLRDYSSHKLAPRSASCVFLGYSTKYKGYRCLDPSTNRVYTTRHAQFDENHFPFKDPRATAPSDVHLLTTYCDDYPLPVTPPAPSPAPIPHLVPPLPCTMCATPPVAAQPFDQPSPSPSSSPSSPVAPSQPSASGHPMTTRSKAGIFKPRHFADLTHVAKPALFAAKEPKGFKTAAKDPKWYAAMCDEMKALRLNATWDLVPRPANSNIVGSKWVFRTKFLVDGSIDKFKARLVAQGFTQVPGIDYSATFSPVVKASTVRIILSLAVLNRWPLHQLDVKNAFLHGELSDVVHMEQPPGFIDTRFPNHVCRLKKALYGLKQAPRAWFQRLSSFLLSIGFTCSRADTSLFVFKKDANILYLLVYVDDIILTGNNANLIRFFISRLNKEFQITDLGKLNYFLGLEVSYHASGLFLSQSKYAHDILARAHLLDAKPAATPLSTSAYFTTQGTPFHDPTLYRSLVGALQYLTISRPDLSYAVNQVSQFLHAPTQDHFQAVKRIMRYVKGTLSYGLSFSHATAPTILGYSDADWARCIETRRSTYGYSIFLGGNLVSWSAKKQPTVSRSSCESEYRALANTAAEIIWITHLLRELHVLPSGRPTLLCDNRSALFLSQNPISHKRAKHIDIDYHFVRELVLSGKLHTRYISTHQQLADIFTKSLPRPLFEEFRSKLRVGPPPLRLWGG